MFLHITDARPLHDYVVAVRFDNGESGQADLLPALQGPMAGHRAHWPESAVPPAQWFGGP